MDWTEFVQTVESPPPNEGVIKAAIEWFTNTLQAQTPALAEGFTEESVETKLPADIVLQACCRRLLRAVEAVSKAKRVQAVQSSQGSGAAVAGASAQSLAKLLAPTKAVDVSALLDKASLKGLCFGLQAEQTLWNTMQSHSDECRSAGKKAFLFIDLTGKECLPMWLTPDQIGGKFFLRDDKEWSLHGGQAIANLQDLSRALKSATSSSRFFRSLGQWLGAFMRYAAVAVATQQLSWSDVLSHIDVVTHLAEQERQKGHPPFLAFVYEELMRKNWSRRAEKSDPDLNISQEIQRVDKDVLDIARHRLGEVLKEAGMDGSIEHAPSASRTTEAPKSLPANIDNALIRQSAATEAARKQAEQVSKQLLETQKMILEKGLAVGYGGKGEQKGKRPGSPNQLSNRQMKTQKWHEKGQARREEQSRRKDYWGDRRH